MEYRLLGRSGLKVSALTLGTMTFGGAGFFAKTGSSNVAEARRLIDICRDAGINLIDTANVYSKGLSEEITGEALDGARKDLMVATKARFPMGDGPNDRGLSRRHLIAECEASLRRLRRDYIDLYQLHEWDGQTPLEETMEAMDTLLKSGKVRYIGCSNFSGWHIMKALGIADRAHSSRFVSQQIYYSLQGREAEYELLPISLDQGLGVMVWSPLAGGLLTGKYRRGKPQPNSGRHLQDWGEPPIYDEAKLYDTIEVLVEIATARAGGAGGDGLDTGPARHHHLGDWRAQRGPAEGEFAGGRSESDDGRARQARQGQRADLDLSLLAPGQHRARPPRRRRPGAAGALRARRGAVLIKISIVMVALGATIHELSSRKLALAPRNSWMVGPSPTMTTEQ